MRYPGVGRGSLIHQQRPPARPTRPSPVYPYSLSPSPRTPFPRLPALRCGAQGTSGLPLPPTTPFPTGAHTPYTHTEHTHLHPYNPPWLPDRSRGRRIVVADMASGEAGPPLPSSTRTPFLRLPALRCGAQGTGWGALINQPPPTAKRTPSAIFPRFRPRTPTATTRLDVLASTHHPPTTTRRGVGMWPPMGPGGNHAPPSSPRRSPTHPPRAQRVGASLVGARGDVVGYAPNTTTAQPTGVPGLYLVLPDPAVRHAGPRCSSCRTRSGTRSPSFVIPGTPGTHGGDRAGIPSATDRLYETRTPNPNPTTGAHSNAPTWSQPGLGRRTTRRHRHASCARPGPVGGRT